VSFYILSQLLHLKSQIFNCSALHFVTVLKKIAEAIELFSELVTSHYFANPSAKLFIVSDSFPQLEFL
jgi:hypothetical protein